MKVCYNTFMRVKIVKNLPKSKLKNKKSKNNNTEQKKQLPPVNKFTEKYLDFYDDIKIPTKRYDW
ncbi:MAG: hypothetical protein IKA36_02965 [Clostridia bacterium]|nr:hypothetical protein [Clostridia bacterium]